MTTDQEVAGSNPARRAAPVSRAALVGRLPPPHPLLLAAYMVLFLFSRNLGEVRLGEVWATLGVAVATAALVYALLALRLGARRAALLTSVLVVGFYAYGHARTLVEWRNVPFAEATPFVWVTVVALLGWLAVRARRHLAEATTVMNAVSALLVGLALVPAVTHLVSSADERSAADAIGADDVDGLDPATAQATTRDIYYLVFDRYGGEVTLDELYGFDNRPFLDRLAARGFTIADYSRANHLKTAHSLASSLNMRHLTPLADTYGTGSASLLPVYDLLAEHQVGRFLQEHGYTYVQIGSWWDPTATNPTADLNWGYEGRSDFADTLIETTALGSLALPLVDGPDLDVRTRHRRAAEVQLSRLRAVRELDGPTFTFAHVLLPHEPYVFDADGSPVSAAEERQRSHEENFNAQLRYLNREIDALLDDLLDAPPDEQPIVILQGDEGPHPRRYREADDTYNWKVAPDEDLAEKFSILNALYLPGVEPSPVYDDITPVNTFRLVFNTYFGTDLPLMPDESFVHHDTTRPYDYLEVTDRLDRWLRDPRR